MIRLRRSFRYQRSGFTLLELILAVGLTSLLMAAVYGAMSAYWNLAMDSHEEIERAQIARSLLQRLARDIQSCTFAEQALSLDGADTEADDGTMTDAGAGTVEAGVSVYGNGLLGTDRELVLYVSTPAADLDYVPAVDAVGSTARHSDLMIVRWLLARSNGGGLAAAVAEEHATDGAQAVAGLARGSGGVSGFGRAIENEDISLQMESTGLLAAEVQDILFEYFDGVDWLAEWDSSVLNRMPLAVRITLTLRKPPSSDDTDRENSQDLPPTTHGLVVPVPVASPWVEEAAI